MIPASMFDHTAKVWRSTEAAGATYREVVRTWAAVSDLEEIPLKLDIVRERVEDSGGGERVGGEYHGFTHAGAGILELDVLEILAGPEAGAKLEVNSRSVPGGHHTELVLVPWTGALS